MSILDKFATLKRQHDTLLAAAVEIFESEGIHLRPATDFAPELKDADIDEAYCIDPSGLQSPEFEIALISAGPAIDPGMPRVAGSGGEAAWVLRNAFGSRPLLQPSLVTDWFIEFSGSNSFDAVAVYPDGRTAVVYYRD